MLDDLTKDVIHNNIKLLVAFIVGVIFAFALMGVSKLIMAPPAPVDYGGIVWKVVC